MGDAGRAARTRRGLHTILAGILADAATLLELEGWRPPAVGAPGLAVSGADGAIARATGDRPPPGFGMSLAEQAHWAIESRVHRLVSAWEADSGRTEAEVLQTLRDCAESLRSGG